jgi:hypothetical protein
VCHPGVSRRQDSRFGISWSSRDRRGRGGAAWVRDTPVTAENSQRPSSNGDKSSLILHAAKRRVVLEVSSVLGSNHTDDRSRQEEAALDGIPSARAGSHRDTTHTVARPSYS